MNTYETVKNRLIFLCGEKRITINKLATESGVAPSTIKNILYRKFCHVRNGRKLKLQPHSYVCKQSRFIHSKQILHRDLV